MEMDMYYSEGKRGEKMHPIRTLQCSIYGAITSIIIFIIIITITSPSCGCEDAEDNNEQMSYVSHNIWNDCRLSINTRSPAIAEGPRLKPC